MRLLRDIPQIEKKIESGELSLTNLNLAQSLFSKEKHEGRPLTVTQKSQVLVKLEGQSTREAEKIVFEISPKMKKGTKSLSIDMIEDQNLRAKLLKLKGKFAHTNPNISLEELMHKLCDQALAEKLPSAPKVTSLAELRRSVWKRDQSRCTHCKSTYALEIDHIVPRALGGGSTFENMRLLCRNCNQRSAIEHFGVKKMERHIHRNAESH